MFQKQTFGTNTTGFGTFNSGATTSSPFSSFKPTTGASTFGAPSAFGAGTSAQPAAGGGLFGASNTSTGLFGSTTSAAPAPSFGSTGGFSFGSNTSSGGLFNTSGSGLLFGGTQNANTFAAKPAGFGFGSTATTGTTGGGLFGSTPSTSTGLFGQQTNTLGGGGLFSNTGSTFGQQTATGTAHTKYNPVVGTDVVVKGGSSQNINIKHHCITCMKEYESKSLEELRLEDYTAGRKGSSGGMFGTFQQPTENKPLFGGTTFGQPATTSAPSLFGGGSLGSTGGFGQTNTFSFGSSGQGGTNTTGLFGATKPTFGATTAPGTGLFGATTTQPATFGTNTSTFGFGSTTQNQSGGLFGAQPASTGFGATNTTGFGAFGSGGGGLFAAKPQQTTAPTFGTTATPFGGVSSGFGTGTAGSGLFGNNTFGKPPTAQPTFGFNTQPTLGTGLGAGTTNTFQTRGAAPAFGLGTGGSLFQQPQPTNTFNANTSLGGGLFGTTPSLGGSLGMGQVNANTSMLPGGGLQGAPGSGVHEQVLNLVVRPYGDSALFKDLPPDTSTSGAEFLKPTNPAAVKAVLESSGHAHGHAGYKLTTTSPAGNRLKVVPRAPLACANKKSLFDGLEESDASLEDMLSLKPSRKRLVLRPKERRSEGAEGSPANDNRSLEEQEQRTSASTAERNGRDGRDVRDAATDTEEKRAPHADSDSDLGSSERSGNWLSSSKAPSSQGNGKQLIEMVPRLYPNLYKELPEESSERRASWLTTKPLRKPLVSNCDSAENSVRELGGRADVETSAHDKENVDNLSVPSADDWGALHFCAHRSGQLATCSACEKIAHQIRGVYVSEEENVSGREAPPHPAGVKLTRPGYYTIPSLDEITKYIRPDGSCVVPHLTVGRRNYGNVFYDCEMDVAGLDLDALVHFLNKEVIVYPEDSEKPPVGEGLNRRAVVTLDRVWPRDKAERRPIVEPERLLKMDYEGKLRRACDKHDTKFIEYRPQTGSWVFRVEHFSKYGLTDSDEDDDPTPEVLKRQLLTQNQSLQRSAQVPQAPKPPATAPGLASATFNSGVGGLGGLGGLGGADMPPEQMFSMQHASLSSLSLMNGSAKAFEMDTTEDNAEAHSLYQDNRASGVKSPTSELARLEQRHSHSVQLMKASLYADTEMEEDMSVSSGDQLVPAGVARSITLATSSLPRPERRHSEDAALVTINRAEEVIMRPLVVQPHTIVLKYHRKIPPFKRTIAGRLNAACVADMSVSHARHSRLGFGPRGAIVFPTTYDCIADLPKGADLSSLGHYLRGRGEDDWSEAVVARMAIGHQSHGAQECLSKQLTSLLEHSTVGEGAGADTCPRLVPESCPRRRLRLLHCLMRHAEGAQASPTFGVSGAYCLEVWKLCDALWGADLENDGVPGTDVQSVVNRHKQLLHWLKEVVSDDTDRELATAATPEPEDETDMHSGRVWTLLLGGRVVEACKLARDHGDLNMAALIAQASGDPSFRKLVSRQLHVWRQCGADSLLATHRHAALQLLAGERAQPAAGLLGVAPWPAALRAVASHLCPQVPTLEQVVRKYCSLFVPEDAADEELDLSSLPEEEAGMRYPLPPYAEDYRLSVNEGSSRRRVLDLRYELIRARAYNVRPRLRPAAYTPDPLDYSLCFLLGCWFGTPSLESITGVAEQLEASGHWHLAVLALAYHPNEIARGYLIRAVLTRHAPARADSPELKARLELMKKLRVPQPWILLAQAYRAKYERAPTLEAEHLGAAGHWNAAHRVLIEELLPRAVLADNLQSIKPLVERMAEAAQRHEVSGWQTGGEALFHYLHVCDEIRGLACAGTGAGGSAVAVGERLEALRPRLAAACLALRGKGPRSARHAAARAEMGARLVQLALAGGASAHVLAGMLRALELPPDCTARAQHQITAELAEQASELCIETSSVSPSSSHLRATVQS